MSSRIFLYNQNTANAMQRMCFPRTKTILSSISHTFPSKSRCFAVKTINVPFMGDSISEGKILEYSKSVGDFVNVDEVVAVIETDKTSLEIRSTEEGVLKAIHQTVDATVKVDAPLFDIDSASQATTEKKDGKGPAGEKKAAAEIPETTASEKTAGKVFAGKETAIGKDGIANAAGEDGGEVKAETTKQGFAEEQTKCKTVKTKCADVKTANAPESAGKIGLRSETRVPLSRMRIKIAERLKESQNTAASLTTFNSIDCTALLKMKSSYQKEFEDKTGVKLGFMSAFVKAAAMALKRFPEINGYFDLEAKSIILHDYVDISVAVAGPKGLVVPVLRNVELMSFAEVEKSIKNFALAAKEGKLSLEDMKGGTFTISNSGVYKSLIGTPIINPPQSAVLGIYGIHDTPVVIGGEVKVRPVMQIALSYDHRIVDGREAVLFIRAIKEYIEDPLRILLY